MVDRIPRSTIQLATLQAARAELDRRGAADLAAVPVSERPAFVQAVQTAIAGMPAGAVEDALRAEWTKGNESLLSSLRRSQLNGIFERAAHEGTPIVGAPRPAGTQSPLALRVQAASGGNAPFWHRTTAEGPYGG